MDLLSVARDIFDAIVYVVDFVPGLRILLGLVLLFLVPGFAWSFVLFRNRQMILAERLVLSFGLSIALVTLSMFFLHLVAGARFSAFNFAMDILALASSAAIIYFVTSIALSRMRN